MPMPHFNHHRYRVNFAEVLYRVDGAFANGVAIFFFFTNE